MSVSSFSEINDQRTGDETYKPDGTTVSTYIRAWRATTTAASDDAKTVFNYASAPNIGSAHNTHAAAKCLYRSASPQEDGTKKVWILTARYSTEFDIRENPLDDPAKTEWSSESYQTPVWEEIDGNAIVNSAGDPFDPPAEKDDSRWTSITRKNVADAVPAWMFAYQDGVNSDNYTIDGKLIAAGESKISAIHLSEAQERNDIAYRVLTVTCHYRGEGDDAGSSGYGSGSGADEVEPWDLSILDAGMREIDPGSGSAGLRNIKNVPGDGEEVTAPVPLDGSGTALDDPTPGTAVYRHFEVYHKRLFAQIAANFL